MLGYWPYATHKKTNFDIYVYLPQLRRKPGILNTRLVYIFFSKKKELVPAGTLALVGDLTGHKI